MKKCFLLITALILFWSYRSCIAQTDTTEIKKIMALFERESNTNPSKSIELGKKAESLLNEQIPLHFHLLVYRRTGESFSRLGDQKNALDYLYKASKCTAENDYKSKGDINGSIGMAYNITNDFKNSISYLLLSIKFYEKAKVIETKWSVKQSLAICYAQTGNLDKAIRYLFEVIKTQGKIGCQEHLIAESYINLGVMFDMKNNSDSALKFYRVAYSILSKKDNSPSLAMVLNNMGAISFKVKEYKQGYKYLEDALEIMKKTGDKRGTALAQNNLSNAYIGNNELKKALVYARDAMSTADSFNLMNEYKSACFNLSSIYYKLGNKDEAYNYCMRYAELNDSLKDSDNLKQIAEMETKYETDKKQKEIEILNKDKLLHQSQLAQEKYLRYSLTGISSLIIVIAVILFLGLKNKQRINRELDLKNIKIEQAYLLIEDKQKEILDSIHYAHRIQKALITSERYIDRNLSRLMNR